MDYELVKTLGQIAGIGGISFGVLLLLFRDVIRKRIFPTLTKQQGFRLIVLFLVLVWSAALAGLGAWVWVERRPVTNSDGSVAASELFDDDVVQVLDHSIDDNQAHVLVFDVVLRNPGSNPINVTGVRLTFDPELSGRLTSGLYVSETYVLTVADDGASSLGPNGRFEADAWYPTDDGQRMIVTGPLSQSLPPKTTDRFRIAVEFASVNELRGPLNSIKVSVRYDGGKRASGDTIDIRR